MPPLEARYLSNLFVPPYRSSPVTTSSPGRSSLVMTSSAPIPEDTTSARWAFMILARCRSRWVLVGFPDRV